MMTWVQTVRDALIQLNCGTGAGGFKQGNSCGRRTDVDFDKPSQRAPKLISPQAAERMLRRGVKVKDARGKEIVFGKSLLAHWHKTARNPNARKQRLLWMIETVRNAKPFNAGKRDYYMKTFQPKGERGSTVVVSVEKGFIHTAIPMGKRDVRRVLRQILSGERRH